MWQNLNLFFGRLEDEMKNILYDNTIIDLVMFFMFFLVSYSDYGQDGQRWAGYAYRVLDTERFRPDRKRGRNR